MEVPFMRSYALALVKACHKRGAPAMGGMSALIPIKGDPVANEKALAGIRHDKTRDANDGYDGGWVAHPGLVPIAMEEFVKVLGDKPNQWEKQRRHLRPQGLAQLPARAADHRGRRAQQHQRRHPLPRLLARRQRLRADPQPDGRRRHCRNQPLAGLAVGGVAQGQARRRPQGHRRDGARHDPEELAKVKAVVTAQGEKTETYDQAAKIFDKMSLARVPGVPHPAAVRSDGISIRAAYPAAGHSIIYWE
jgi:malate synthase